MRLPGSDNQQAIELIGSEPHGNAQYQPIAEKSGEFQNDRICTREPARVSDWMSVQIGGYLRVCAAAPVTDRNPAGAVRREACCSGPDLAHRAALR